jgi:hypothetical protein
MIILSRLFPHRTVRNTVTDPVEQIVNGGILFVLFSFPFTMVTSGLLPLASLMQESLAFLLPLLCSMILAALLLTPVSGLLLLIPFFLSTFIFLGYMPYCREITAFTSLQDLYDHHYEIDQTAWTVVALTTVIAGSIVIRFAILHLFLQFPLGFGSSWPQRTAPDTTTAPVPA